MWNINAPQGRIPCVIFTKFAEFVPRFRMHFKISLDLLKGLWSYGGFKLTGLVTPKFSAPLAAKLCIRSPKVFEVQEHTRWGSHFTRRQGGQKRWVFLSVCLFVRLLNVRVCAPDFAIKALEYRMPLDTWKICSCAAVFNFLRLLPTGDTTKCRCPKNRKNWGFRCQKATE